MNKEDWFDDFFRIVDRNRLDRGRKLFQGGHLKQMNIHQYGFHAIVDGTQLSEYEIHSQFPINEHGMPDLEHLSIECSCKDWVEFCKHSICAMISYCEGRTSASSENHSFVYNKKKTEVEGVLNRNMDQLMDLGAPPVQGMERSFDQMQDMIRKKLRNSGS